MKMKLTQKVDHFTVFKNSLALVAARRSSRQITQKGLAGWNVQGSIRDVFIGWGAGDGLAAKGYSSKLWESTIEAQKPALRDCAGSLMAEMKHIQQCGRLGCSEKQQHWIQPAQTLASA